MCGRYTLTGPERIRDEFAEYGFEEFSEYRLPRFNIAPTQAVLGVRNDGRDCVDAMKWGIRGRINARAETVAVRGHTRRCILFADGFYEWRGGTPMYFTLRDGALFALAGLWEAQAGADVGCSIITCAPNELVAPIHNRMPVILARERLALWLCGDSLPTEVANDILRPYDAGAMHVRAASKRLNNARYDAPDVLIADVAQPTLFAK